MKTNILIALLSIGILVTFTSVLVMKQYNQQIFLSESYFESASCLNLQLIKKATTYPIWIQYANNSCSKPQKFIITYKYISTSPAEIFESECLSQDEIEPVPFNYPYTSVLDARQIDC